MKNISLSKVENMKLNESESEKIRKVGFGYMEG